MEFADQFRPLSNLLPPIGSDFECSTIVGASCAADDLCGGGGFDEQYTWRAESPAEFEQFAPEEVATTTTVVVMERRKGEVSSPFACHVCESPTANTLHFGGRSCKACAAFFRRSVSMSMTYECIEDQVRGNCKIHYELRMLCRHCRFIKCLDAGMKHELVQARKDEIRQPKRKSRGLVRVCEPKKAEKTGTYEEYVQMFQTTSSMSTTNSDSDGDINVVDGGYQPIDLSTTTTSSVSPNNVPFDPSQATTSGEYYSANCFPQQSADSLYDDRMYSIIDHYVRTEASLNDRRRLMYTDTQIRDVFDTMSECPYERQQLKLFNYRTFCGFVKHDFVMMLDYVNQFPDFLHLMRNEKNAFFRMACAVDAMMSSAYYTSKIGIAENLLVLFNGDYIPMQPMPMTGNEPNAASAFENNDEFMKYKTLMPLKLKQYYDMAVPFSRLNVSFEEFVLLKALTIWQISNYKLLDEGRAICARQRDALVQALHRVVEERAIDDPATRVGQLLLSMSYIIEQVQAMTTSYLMITFFDVVTCDSIMRDMLTFKDS